MSDLLRKLGSMSPDDLALVERFADHLLEVNTVDPRGVPPDDAELYWAELLSSDDLQWRREAAVPLWEELAEKQMNPSMHLKRIAQLKLKLRALGEL